jgi:CzcA family heavy metal efflux pump
VKVLQFLGRHAVALWMTTAVLVVLGVGSALQMPSGIYPEVEFPRIVVVARSGGAPPDVFLTAITRPLEQTLTSVLGIQRIRSKTIRGATEISLQFAAGADMWRALQLVESRVAEVRSALPPDAEIVVEKVTTGSFPVVTFNVSGPVDPRELRELAEYTVRPALGNVPGVGRVEVIGGDVREIEIILDQEALGSLRLNPNDIVEKLRVGMGLNAVGRIERDHQLVTVLADAQPQTIEQIRDMPILVSPDGAVVALRSIAEVVEGAEDRLIRVAGPRGTAVGISVARLPGASTPKVVELALAAVKSLMPTLPPSVAIEPVYDQASLVSESMNSVRDAILVGIGLCAAVIAIFLKDLRAGLLAALSVPITLAITFVAMRLAQQTLNLMSLGGMAVAIGLVVDDAIVVVEAISRHRDEGADPVEAAHRGATELAPAVIGTTLTTVVVLVPLAFLNGIIGDFFRALAFTLTAAVLISLVVALCIIPLVGIGKTALKTRPENRGPTWYDRFVRTLLKRPLLAVGALLLVLGAGVVVAPRVGQGFLPTMDEGAFVLDYFLPAGTSLATTERFARGLEDELKQCPDVLTFSRRTGAELGPAAATQLNRGDVMVRLKPRAARGRSSEEVIAELRERIENDLPEVRVEFVQVLQDVLNDLAGSPRPIEVKLLGPDYEKLNAIADSVASEMEKIKGVVDLYAGHEREVPELRFESRRDAAARLGVNPDDVSAQLTTALLGTVVGNVRKFDRLINVRVRYPNPVRFDQAKVMTLPFSARGQNTTFEAVSHAALTASRAELMHEALQPMVDVTADHEDRDLGSISGDIESVISRLSLPQGYRVLLGGQIEGERATVRDLGLVAALAILLVLTVLAGQFRRLRLAILVLGSIPIAAVGALLALFTTATPLNASSLMGMVLLVGLVVKNGVLLLEEAEKQFDRGADAIEAVAKASERRLRPVLMTTIATLAGLLPLALGIGAGAELQRPLAIAVIGGLLTSTLATLGLLPAFAHRLLTRRT